MNRKKKRTSLYSFIHGAHFTTNNNFINVNLKIIEPFQLTKLKRKKKIFLFSLFFSWFEIYLSINWNKKKKKIREKKKKERVSKSFRFTVKFKSHSIRKQNETKMKIKEPDVWNYLKPYCLIVIINILLLRLIFQLIFYTPRRRRWQRLFELFLHHHYSHHSHR